MSEKVNTTIVVPSSRGTVLDTEPMAMTKLPFSFEDQSFELAQIIRNKNYEECVKNLPPEVRQSVILKESYISRLLGTRLSDKTNCAERKEEFARKFKQPPFRQVKPPPLMTSAEC
jgi:hypothetical protein